MTISIRQRKSFFWFFFLFFLLQQQLFSSVLSQTSVISAEGLAQVDSLKAGSLLIGFNFNAQNLEDVFIETQISAIKQSVTDIVIEIHTSTGVILSPLNQHFYDPVHCKWIAAQDLTSQNFFLSDALEFIHLVDINKLHTPNAQIYDISLDEYHAFFISDGYNSVLVHNEPITITLTALSAITLPQVVVGVVLFSGAAYLFPKLFGFFKGKNKNKNREKAKSKERKECEYKDITKKGSRPPNTETDLTKEEFQETFLNEGWIHSQVGGNKSPVDQYSKDDRRYILRDDATSTGRPTADYYRPGSGKADIKIRLR